MASVQKELGVASKMLKLGKEEESLDALVASWRQLRAAEIAELVEALSRRLGAHVPKLEGPLEPFQARWLAVAHRGRAVDLPALLDSLLHTTQRSGVAITAALAERGATLGSWPADPRFGVRVARALADRPFGAMAKGNQPFWAALLKVVVSHDDPRVATELSTIDFKKMFRGWNDVAKRIAFFQPLVDEAAAEIRRRHPQGPPPLPKELVREVRRVAATIDKLPAVATDLASRIGAAPTVKTSPRARALPERRGGSGESLDDALRRAAEAAHSGDYARALEALLDAWRIHRSPILTRLVSRVSVRLEAELPAIHGASRAESQRQWLAVAAKRCSADLPRLLSSLTDTMFRATDALARLRAIDNWPLDPRCARGALRHLERPGLWASSTRPFWLALFDFIAAHADIEVAHALDDVISRFDAILVNAYTDLTATRRWFVTQMRSARDRIRDTEEVRDGSRELPASTMKLCQAIEARLESLEAPVRSLLSEIASSPDDDAPRQVYADLLLERGDPRGELIALQLADRDRARQQELIKEHGEKWLDPLDLITTPAAVRFERGFLVDVHTVYVIDPKAVKGHSLWSTVKRLHLSADRLPSFVNDPIMRSIKHLGANDAQPILELLSLPKPTLSSRDVLPFESLGLGGDFASSAEEQRALLKSASKLRKLRTLELANDFDTAKKARWLLSSPLGEKLTTLVVVEGWRDWDGWSKALKISAVRSLRFVEGSGDDTTIDLSRDDKGAFAVATIRVAAGPRWIDWTRLADVIAQLPRRSLSQVILAGRTPSKAERGRLLQACERIGANVVEHAPTRSPSRRG